MPSPPSIWRSREQVLYITCVRWPDGRPACNSPLCRTSQSGCRRVTGGEESPGSTETRCRITSGGGDPRESATENRPPAFVAPNGAKTGKGETVRQERTARTATDAARQAPPGARPNRDGVRLFPGCCPGRSREAPGDRRPRGMAISRFTPRTEPGLQAI